MKNKVRGSVLLEFALCIPVLLMVILGGMDLLFAETAKANVSYLATQAATCLPKGCDVLSYVATAAPGLSLNASLLTTTVSGNAVTVSYQYMPLGPVFPQLTLSCTATAGS